MVNMFKTINIKSVEDGMRYNEMINYFQVTIKEVIKEYENESTISVFKDFKFIFDKHFRDNVYEIELDYISIKDSDYIIGIKFFNNSYMEFAFYKEHFNMENDERAAI